MPQVLNHEQIWISICCSIKKWDWKILTIDFGPASSSDPKIVEMISHVDKIKNLSIDTTHLRNLEEYVHFVLRIPTKSNNITVMDSVCKPDNVKIDWNQWHKLCDIVQKHFEMGRNIRQRDIPGFEQEMIEAGLEWLL